MLREGGHGAYKDPGMFRPERFPEEEPDPGISGVLGSIEGQDPVIFIFY